MGQVSFGNTAVPNFGFDFDDNSTSDWNQVTNASAFTIGELGRITAIHAYWLGDNGDTPPAQHSLFDSGGVNQSNSAQFTAASCSGCHCAGCQAFQVATITSHIASASTSWFFSWWRACARQHVWSVYNGGSFNVQHNCSCCSLPGTGCASTAFFCGGVGMFADYWQILIFVRRSGAWSRKALTLRRSGAWLGASNPPAIFVRRSGAWTTVGELNRIPDRDIKQEELERLHRGVEGRIGGERVWLEEGEQRRFGAAYPGQRFDERGRDVTYPGLERPEVITTAGQYRLGPEDWRLVTGDQVTDWVRHPERADRIWTPRLWTPKPIRLSSCGCEKAGWERQAERSRLATEFWRGAV